ncbi:MAG TPA: dockerin, partial [Polyangiaceae bacterium]|nr:dockerin [Polyangiaceae bacterium]
MGAGGVGGSAGDATAVRTPWDWTGIIGTGQSLSVGEPDGVRNTPAAAARLTTQPFSNQQLSTGSLPWPIDANDPSLRLVPLVEPIGRPSTAYPSSWPTNIAGETHHTAMANQITTLVQAAGGADYVTIHSAVGENGQALNLLKKGATPG